MHNKSTTTPTHSIFNFNVLLRIPVSVSIADIQIYTQLAL